ncbi:MAG TPA: M20/M25/M40 family metallo-hydrolase [Pyrinomonadaceae bacterium]|nr:M20/M25/M40 family metallo-hydrolase [Pyrinomonadaceae bacterium]
MKRILMSVLVTFCFLEIAIAQSLSADEKKIVNYVDAHIPDAISLLEKVVNIESASQNVAGVKSVGAVFKGEFEALGMKARWIDMPAEMERAGHLVAETTGARGKRLLLLGHIDTVLEGERFRREGNKAYGTGSSDMKGGDVVLLYALKALADVGALKDTRVVVMLTGDEESVGRPVEKSRGDMIALAQRSDVALSFEGARGRDATVGRRGSSSWMLQVSATTGHSSQIFKERMGSGAILEAARILNQFYDQLHADKNVTFNPSLILGGTKATRDGTSGTATGKTNVVAKDVIVIGDLRFSNEEQKEAARAKMRALVAANLPRTSATITFGDGIPAMFPTEGNYALLTQLSKVSEDLGFGKVGTVDPADRGAGDIAYVSHLISGLDGLGADGGGAHAAGETVNLESMPMLIKRAAILIYRLTR